MEPLEDRQEVGQEVVLGGLFTALAVVLPLLFHLVGLGKVFLPMHLPVLTAGFLVSPAVAVSVGVLAPLLSAALTGMPPLPLAPLMAVELAILGGSAALFYGRLRWPWGFSLPLAILCARSSWVLMVLGLAPLLHLPEKMLSVAAVLQGLPGTALQLVVVPLVVLAVEQRRKPKGA
jgi:hypothetical protein